VAVEPESGRVLGDALVPGCAAAEGAAARHDQRVPVAEIPGVDPDVAVVWALAHDRIFVREAVAIPPEISRLVHAPECDALHEPILLRGPWLGILGPDGKTELDMVPPYDVFLLVHQTSTSRYDRAHLTVRVPASLGLPLDEAERSLAHGATIAVTATCRAGGFVAREVEAVPPT